MIVISSDLEELLAISHRVMVMANGSVKGEFLAKDVSTDEVMALAAKVGRRFGVMHLLNTLRSSQRNWSLGSLGSIVHLLYCSNEYTFLTVPTS